MPRSRTIIHNKLVQGSDRIRCAVLYYTPLRNAQKIDLSRAYDVTDTLVDGCSTGELQFTVTFDKAGQTGLGVAFYNIDTLELCLVVLETINFGSNNILRYYKIEDSQIGNEGDLPIQIEIQAIMFDSDVIDVELLCRETVSLEAALVDSDSIALEMNYPQATQIIANFNDADDISVSISRVYNTAEPTITFVSWSYDIDYTFVFDIKNNDDVAAEIFADVGSTPTTSRGTVVSQGTTQISVSSLLSTTTVYARAKASNKNYSTVDSATGTET